MYVWGAEDQDAPFSSREGENEGRCCWYMVGIAIIRCTHTHHLKIVAHDMKPRHIYPHGDGIRETI